jgi:hypothetical protein
LTDPDYDQIIFEDIIRGGSMFHIRFNYLLPAALLFITTSAFADAVFTDSTFNIGDYTVTGPFKSDSASSVTFGQCTTCGNPGDALQIQMNLPSIGDLIALGFVNASFSYNPQTQGAITSITASVDKDLIVNQDETGAGNTFRPLIEQDGIFYMAAIPGPTVTGTTTGFNTLSQSGLTASNFLQYDFSTGTFGITTPNFSGDTMLFGLGQISQFNTNNLLFEADYDNLKLDIASAPEPATLAQLGVLVALLAGVGMMRKRNLVGS